MMDEEIVPSISRADTDFEERDETAFPEAETADGGRFGDYEVYDKVEVDDWFKRCIADLPGPHKFPEYNEENHRLWYEKWFSQFRKEGS